MDKSRANCPIIKIFFRFVKQTLPTTKKILAVLSIFTCLQLLNMTREEKFMQEAIALSQKGMDNNEGGPFGCIIVKGDEIVGRGNNKVSSSNDPTAHAEVTAIRDACKNLGTFQLSDCEVYTSCEPCPMCLGAIYWARPKVVYFANNRQDAADIGFDDSMIYDEMNASLDERKIPILPLGRNDALKVFRQWKEKDDKTLY